MVSRKLEVKTLSSDWTPRSSDRLLSPQRRSSSHSNMTRLHLRPCFSSFNFTARARILEPRSSLRFGSPEARAERESSGPRITQMASPPRSSSINSNSSSTPGGSRRLSSQASSQILSALASGEGSAWLASLLGNNAPRSDSPSRAATPGGGFKLDPKMLATLQTVLSSGGNLSGDSNPDYFGGNNNINSGRQNPSTPARSSNLNSNGFGTGSDSTFQPSAYASFSNPNSNVNSLRNSSNSNALVHSPSNLSAFGIDSFDPSSTSRPATPNSLALSLSRATQNLQGINSDNSSVQDKINALVESLKLDPDALNSILNNNGTGNEFKGMTPQPSTYQNDSSTSNGLGEGGDNEVDMDSLLKEFLNTNAPNLSNSEFSTTPSRSNHQELPGNEDQIGKNGWDTSNDNSTLGVGDFAFSPATSAAFLQNMTNGNDFGDIDIDHHLHNGDDDGVGGTTVGSWGVEKSSSNPPSDGTNTGGTSTPIATGSPSDSTSTSKNNGRKRKVPTNFQGALGDDIEKVNAQTREDAKNAGLTQNNNASTSNLPHPSKKTRQ